MKIKKTLAGAGIGILAIAGYLGFAPDNLSPEQIVQVEQQAQELFGGNANNVKQRIFNEMKPAQVKVKGKDWELTGMHFKSLLKENAEDGWEYEENGKTLGFVSKGMAWDGKKIKTKAAKVKGEISELTVKYEDALGAGIDIKIVQDNYHFQKIIEIESLASLGEIPAGAEFLEFSFKMSGDFDLPRGRISAPIPFGTNSFLHPVRAWDGTDTESGAFGEITGKILTKKIPVAWLLTADFPISTDADITYGSEAVFETSISNLISIDNLDETHVVVAYVDQTDSYNGKACVGSISGTTITWGTPVTFNATGTGYTSVAALDSTHFVVVYKDDGGDDYGIARVGLVSGTAISSFGAENIFNSDVTNNIDVAALDSTHFVVGYLNFSGSYYITCIVGVTSGTTISSYGAANDFSTSATMAGIAALDSTHFVVVWDNASNGTAVVGVTSGTTISSFGSAVNYNTGETNNIDVAALDSTHFVVSYRDVGNSNYGTAVVGVTSGTTISSFGSESAFESASTEKTSVTALDSKNFIVSYVDSANSEHGTSRAGLTDGSTAISSWGTVNVFNAAAISWNDIVAISETHFVIGFHDDGNSSYGTGIAGSIPAAAAGNTGAFFQFFD